MPLPRHPVSSSMRHAVSHVTKSPKAVGVLAFSATLLQLVVLFLWTFSGTEIPNSRPEGLRLSMFVEQPQTSLRLRGCQMLCKLAASSMHGQEDPMEDQGCTARCSVVASSNTTSLSPGLANAALGRDEFNGSARRDSPQLRWQRGP